MGVGVGQLKSEGHFFLAVKENKFYSPGTAQQFFLWSIKHSQESVGVLAEEGGELVVELVAPCNTLACNVLQSCGWAGEAMDGLHGSHTDPEPWDVGGLYRLMLLHLVWTCVPTLLTHRSVHWSALTDGRAERWPIDSKVIYHPCLPTEGHTDLRHRHRCSHTDPKEPEEQIHPLPAWGGDGVQPTCCSWHEACLQGAMRTPSTFSIRQLIKGNEHLERRKETKDRLAVNTEEAHWGLWREMEGISWYLKAPWELLHSAHCRMQRCGWIPKGVCFAAVNAVPWFTACCFFFFSWLVVWNTCANWPEFCFSYCSRMIGIQSAVSWVLSTWFPSRNLLTSDFISSAHSL